MRGSVDMVETSHLIRRRRALLLAADTFEDRDLTQLRAPSADVEALSGVLREPSLGDFDVAELVNASHAEVALEIDGFFSEAASRDLLLLYVSGHGLRAEDGGLFLATSTTRRTRLRSTAIADSWLRDVMRHCRAESIVLILDCCYSGAFGKGLGPKGRDTHLNVAARFEGRGHVVLTASDELQYAYEDHGFRPVRGPYIQEPHSLFTRFLVHGISSGDADLNEDGVITIDELYRYAFEQMRRKWPQQTPGRSGESYGDIPIAKARAGSSLLGDLRGALHSHAPSVRAAAVHELGRRSGQASGADTAEIERELSRALVDVDEAVRLAAMSARTPMPATSTGRGEVSSGWLGENAPLGTDRSAGIQEISPRGEGSSSVPPGQRSPDDGELVQPCSDASRLSTQAELDESARSLLSDVFAIIEEHGTVSAVEIDRERVESAWLFACERLAGLRGTPGDDFIHHPVGVAKICAGMRLDTETLCAALLHDTVERASASVAEVGHEFGDEIANIVAGVTHLTNIIFRWRDEVALENCRRMMVATATDVRIVLIALADRLNRMRTIDGTSKQKQIHKAKETLEIYASVADRLGIHAIKWELEDLAFLALHPRKYHEIKGLVNQQRDEREQYVEKAGAYLLAELQGLGIEANISGRARHFYSIYSKLTKRGREFNEIYDLTAMRVIVQSVKDCYGAVGVVHSLWKPLPGRFQDFIAMPKRNLYQSLHTTVLGPEGLPLEIQIRTQDMQVTSEFGVAAHWFYKDDSVAAEKGEAALRWLRSLPDEHRPAFVDASPIHLSEDVYVFTPNGELTRLRAGSTPVDLAYAVHTDLGHRFRLATVDGRTVDHRYVLHTGEHVQIVASSTARGPNPEWLQVVATKRARTAIKRHIAAQSRRQAEVAGRDQITEALRQHGLQPRSVTVSKVLAIVANDLGYRDLRTLFIRVGQSKLPTSVIVRQVGKHMRASMVSQPEPDLGHDRT